ncbi:histidine phosphatase family protein [soil metagenome]
MTVEIFVARHGQNEDNLNGILNGHRDLPLTNLGRQQARDLGQGILDAGLTFNAVYSSPLIRAFETARITAGIAGLPEPEVLQNLIERDFGILSGELANDIEKICPPKDILSVEGMRYFLNPKDGETFPQVLVRGQDVLDYIRKMHTEGKILLVCHGDIGKMIYAAATGKDWKEVLQSFHMGNGDLIDISGNGEVHTIKLEQFNH